MAVNANTQIDKVSLQYGPLDYNIQSIQLTFNGDGVGSLVVDPFTKQFDATDPEIVEIRSRLDANSANLEYYLDGRIYNDTNIHDLPDHIATPMLRSNPFHDAFEATDMFLPDWFTINDTEESIGIPFGIYTSRLFSHNRGDALQIGRDGVDTIHILGSIANHFHPVSNGVFDLGEQSATWRNGYIEDIHTTHIQARLPYQASAHDTTGLHIDNVVALTGNIATAPTYASTLARDTAIDTPLDGQMAFVDGVLERYNGTAWEEIGGLHAGTNANLLNVTSDIIPATHNTYDLGSGSRLWERIHGEAIYTANIFPASANLDSPIRFGRATNSEILVVGNINFADATVSGLPTSLTFTLDSTDGDIILSAYDNGGNLAGGTTTIPPEWLAEALSHYGIHSTGQILVINEDDSLVWENRANQLGINQSASNGNINIILESSGGSAMDTVSITANDVRDALAHTTERIKAPHGLEVPAGRSDDLSIQVIDDTDTGMHFHSSQFSVHLDGQEALRLAPEPSQESLPTLTIPHHLRVGHGTNEDVSIARTADSNTGINFDSAANNTIGLVTFGCERWRVTQAGDLIPDPRDEMDVRVNIGDPDNAHTRVGTVYTQRVNYQTLVQDSARALKFAISDMTDAESIAKLNALRVRTFQYKDNPEVRLAGLVADEITNSASIKTTDNAIDSTTLIAQLLHWCQRQQDQIDALMAGTSTAQPPARTYTDNNDDAARGTPPTGWNADGTRIPPTPPPME